MLDWYLTTASISYLAQFILALAITSHLLRLMIGSIRRRANTLSHVAPLTGFFAGFTLYLLLLFIETVLLPGERLVATYLQIIPLSLGMVCLIQFAYHFPSSAPSQKWERRAVLVLTMVYALWETGYALYRLRLLFVEGIVRFRSDTTDIFLAIIFLWAPLMLLRQSIRVSVEAIHPSSILLHPSVLFRHLWSPQGQAARSARALAFVYLLPFALSVIWLANSFFIIPIGSTNVVFSLGILIALFTFTVVYLNYLPETTTFMVKVGGMALVFLLAAWSVASWVIGPQFIDQYPEEKIPQQRTLRFTPNAAGGYDVAEVSFHFDPVGEKWGNFTEQNWTDLLPLPFPFRFYDQMWREVYVSVVGGISFGRERIYQDLEYRYGSVPGILPFYPAQSNWILREGQVFLNAKADKVTITWRQAAEDFSTVGTYTFQLTLYPGGVFEITHDEITDVKSRIFWTIGVIAGDPTRVPRQVNLIHGLPIGDGAEGIVHDDYRTFRIYLHQNLLPLAWLVVGSVVVFIVGLPLFLHFNLVKPLSALLDGVRRVNAGNLHVAMPIYFQDEIGFLTESFNKMVIDLRASIYELESRVGKRTADLAEANVHLRSEIAERTQAEEALRKVGDELAVLYDISAIANRAVSLDSLLSESLARVMTVIRGDAGVVFLLSDSEGGDGQPMWRLTAHHGIAPEMAMMMDSSSAKRELLDWFAEQREPLLIADAAADDHIPQAMRHAGHLSLLVAPLHEGDHVFGILALARKGGQSFNAEEIALLSPLANLLGVALHSDHLRRLTQQAKILEDRQNLTRNLHDSVTQLLYALVVFTEVGQTQIESGDIKAALPTFARIGDTARQALKEMRFFIHQLRPSLLATEGLVSALHMRLEAVEERSGIRTHLLADENLRLPPPLENELYLIAIEALNNALRHARAKTVTVIVSRNENEIVLEIADDGCGFDAATASKGGMGLITMRERVASLGGDLTISSSRESGTRIRVRVESR